MSRVVVDEKTNEARLIVTSRKYGTFEVLIDLEDAERIRQHQWHVSPRPKGLTYFRTNVYPDSSGVPVTWRLRRFILSAPDGVLVDHVNPDNTLDNRKANLRLCTHTENMHNPRPIDRAKSRYKGVGWEPRWSYWRVRIVVNGKRQYIGRFDSEIDAARAYDDACRKYYGEFAWLNFPTSKAA